MLMDLVNCFFLLFSFYFFKDYTTKLKTEINFFSIKTLLIVKFPIIQPVYNSCNQSIFVRDGKG